MNMNTVMLVKLATDIAKKEEQPSAASTPTSTPKPKGMTVDQVLGASIVPLVGRGIGRGVGGFAGERSVSKRVDKALAKSNAVLDDYAMHKHNRSSAAYNVRDKALKMVNHRTRLGSKIGGTAGLLAGGALVVNHLRKEAMENADAAGLAGASIGAAAGYKGGKKLHAHHVASATATRDVKIGRLLDQVGNAKTFNDKKSALENYGARAGFADKKVANAKAMKGKFRAGGAIAGAVGLGLAAKALASSRQ